MPNGGVPIHGKVMDALKRNHEEHNFLEQEVFKQCIMPEY
jgi:hypothetical protein